MDALRRALPLLLAAAVAFSPAASPAAAGELPEIVRHVEHVRGSGGGGAAAFTSVKGCPAAGTCGLYKLANRRWPTRNGVATMAFRIFPQQPWVDAAVARRAIESAAKAWTAHGAVRFTATVFDPSAQAQFPGPVTGNGVNEIGWGLMEDGQLAGATMVVVRGKVVEADIVLSLTQPWGAKECAGAECTTRSVEAALLARYDIQSVVAHEIGHWLGLEHLGGAAARELTMFTTPAPGDARGATLALGDVLGVRAAYPCRSCRMPRIATP